MRIGQFLLSPVLLVFFLITITAKLANGSSDSDNESTGFTEKFTAGKELNEHDLIKFVNASSESDDILVALFYEVGCQSSSRIVPLWRQTINQLQRAEYSAFLGIKLPLFSTFLVNPTNKHFLEVIPVTHVPSIFFLSKSGVLEDDHAPSLNVLEFEGQKSSASEILKGLRHYLLRFQYSGFQVGLHPSVSLTSISNALTVHTHGIDEMEHIVSKYQEMMFQRTGMPLDPVMSPVERDWVRYMLDESTDPDVYHVICQCRRFGVSTDEELSSVYSAFDDVAHVLSLRRDVVFCVESKCVDEGGINSYQVVESNWTLAPESSLDPNSVQETDFRATISFFCQSIVRPSLIWLDRQVSAPIIFAPNNRLHAALLIDFHNLEQKERMRQAVVEFRRECKAWRVHNLVCYVVPSTDVRFLLQFGIDMWSPMDQNLHTEKNTSFQSTTLFPCLVVTDQREGTGVDYRVLQHPFGNESIGVFLDSVISRDRDLKQQAAKQQIVIRKNSFGVHLLGASNLQTFVSRKDSHSLIMFYSPSCGHCKRLKVIWNQLAKLLEYCGLDYLQIGMFDVSTNELYWSGINVLSVPEIYLLSHGYVPIRYDIDEAGSINSPIDILAWFFDAGVDSASEEELLNLLEGDGTP